VSNYKGPKKDNISSADNDKLKPSSLTVDSLMNNDPKMAKGRYNSHFEVSQNFLLIVLARSQSTAASELIKAGVPTIYWKTEIPVEQRRLRSDVIADLQEENQGILDWMLIGLRDWVHEPGWQYTPAIES